MHNILILRRPSKFVIPAAPLLQAPTSGQPTLACPESFFPMRFKSSRFPTSGNDSRRHWKLYVLLLVCVDIAQKRVDQLGSKKIRGLVLGGTELNNIKAYYPFRLRYC